MQREALTRHAREILRRDPHFEDIRSASIFGSYARGEANAESDIDILIEFEPTSHVGYFALARMQKNLEEALGKKVDLLTPDALLGTIRDDICETSQKIYEKR